MIPNAKVDGLKIEKNKKYQSERPEYRARNGKLQSVVFRTRDKERIQTRHIGKRSKEFKYYEKAYNSGVYNSQEERSKNAKIKSGTR